MLHLNTNPNESDSGATMMKMKLKMQKRALTLSLGALGLTLFAAALSGCNQGVDPAAHEDTAQNQQPVAASDAAITVEPHELKGEELAAFLKQLNIKSETLPVANANPESGALAKSAGGNLCQVNFNSSKGLAHMADRAYAFYASSPWYIEPCFPNYAVVTPSNANSYYLVPEASNICSGKVGMMGNWSNGPGSTCINQKDAATFPRYLAKAAPFDLNAIYVVSLLNAGFGATFNASNFFARSGKLMVYAYGANGSFKTWGPIDATSPKFVSLAGATGLIQLGFYASTSDGVYSVDNINIYE
jgi:hypothetical protein